MHAVAEVVWFSAIHYSAETWVSMLFLISNFVLLESALKFLSYSSIYFF